VNLDDVRRVRGLLADIVETTPLAHSRWLAETVGTPTYLKCENLQRAGSFKIRGAYVRLSRLTDEERARGVVAASAGNHAQGVALAARTLGITATIFMPEGAALPKVQATLGYGADVRFRGAGIADALVGAQEFSEQTGAVLIHPYDHEDVVAGQGTTGLEIIEQLPQAQTILVPLGGGGLVAGIALLKQERPDLRIIGVQAESAAAYPSSLKHGAPQAAGLGSTMADGIAVELPGTVPFAIIKEYVDEVVTVGEDTLSTALIGLLERAKLLVEPAGAAGVAALLERPELASGPTVAVLSGGNIDAHLLLEVIRHGLASAGRFMMFRVRISDRPGELMRLLAELARNDVNVLNVNHDRASEALGVRQVEVALQVATRGPDHRENLRQRLTELGYDLL